MAAGTVLYCITSVPFDRFLVGQGGFFAKSKIADTGRRAAETAKKNPKNLKYSRFNAENALI
ncbi:MAG: hypothetical protein LBI94_02440 [Treponema sp.]|jgi:hypothetical protein|nr:hypothetical protein [Treponema sp.]